MEGGQRGRSPGEERAGSRIPKVVGTGGKQVKFCNISLYFAIDMGQKEEKGKGQEAGVRTIPKKVSIFLY